MLRITARLRWRARYDTAEVAFFNEGYRRLSMAHVRPVPTAMPTSAAASRERR